MAKPPESPGSAGEHTESKAGDEYVAGSLLAHLDIQEQQFLLDLGAPRRFARGEVMFHQGDLSDHIFIVLSGWVRVYESDTTGHTILHALRGPGDILGDEAALQGWARPFSLSTIAAVLAVQLRAAQLQAALMERPALAIALVKCLQVRLREAELARTEMATLDVTRRVATYLSRLAEQHGEPGPDGLTVRIPLTQQDIASRVGASRRAVARVFAQLRDRDVLTIGRFQLVINQPNVLGQLAQPT